jgi:phosphoribosylglycinamide formyltransferase-1
MKLAGLVSGRGSNLEAVLRAVAEGRLPSVEPVLVVSNRPGVRALAVAEAYGVPTLVRRRADHGSAEERDGAIGRSVTEAGADLALLAGYDQLLHRSYFDAFSGRTINIHPSLLPRHGGKGMMGLAVHAAVLAAGDAETGVTVHEVIAELDAGPILRQARLAVRLGEPAEELAARVPELEHRELVALLADLSAAGEPSEPSASMTAASGRRTRPDATQQRSPFDA